MSDAQSAIRNFNSAIRNFNEALAFARNINAPQSRKRRSDIRATEQSFIEQLASTICGGGNLGLGDSKPQSRFALPQEFANAPSMENCQKGFQC
ncbi:MULTISPECIES: hypothetical protein [Bradyrhizobium]|uniref:hypothetical protein n=1 Tax=Bradyrhizobium elkanii TaxID=29448 RepID=UPI0012BBD2A8|nr:hypothetical protein [Bradyrhizobium elkanii]